MPTLFNLPTLAIAIAALLIGALLARSLWKPSAPKSTQVPDKGAADIAAAIRDYFRKSGVLVSAAAARLEGSANYTAMVESEPMKRFRLSHIVEKSLVEHVRKTCDLELDKVYWRFPISDTQQPAESKDAYINEGLMNLNDLSKYEVVDSSIEMFTQASEKTPK
ncbi:hypothetical protein [Lacisediminimonas sp.]|uniref:hypothetical protein n=1 Tax=Lacisediminimonas sp. TaxID=3060582 RepID=UPI00271D4F0E|nr:hypothetical protein [Lacisediminimonas sp.]MDO8301115.1 hypothetical protein [Lacisediminimonas sp.]